MDDLTSCLELELVLCGMFIDFKSKVETVFTGVYCPHVSSHIFCSGQCVAALLFFAQGSWSKLDSS